MIKLTMDMETRSRMPLGGSEDRGLYRYAEDESTDIMCIALRIDDTEKRGSRKSVFVPDKFRRLLPDKHGLPLHPNVDSFLKWVFESGIDVIEAHNAAFELALWRNVMHKRNGYPDLPFDKIRCSAAKASYFALPRSLEGAGSALNLPIQKDPVGKSIMMKMCKPRKPNKEEQKKIKSDTVLWNEDPQDFLRLCQYCIRDIDAEFTLSAALPELPQRELETWQLDYEINNRGIRVDLPAIKKLIDKVAISESKLLLEIQELTKGFVKSARQRDNCLRWIENQGVSMKDFTKDTVIHTLRENLPPQVRRLLEIRQSLGMSSVAKLQAMQDYASLDGRMRGLMLWHGAGTGRFTAKGPQIHNFPRDSYKDKEIEDVLNLSNEGIEFLYDPIIKAASKCLRGMLIAEEGKAFISGDFTQIEMIVLAWLAGEEKVIEQYRQKDLVYEKAAADIYGKPYTQITKEERQIGKVFNLALGYQGWYNALKAMAQNYNIDLPPEERCIELMSRWRASRPATVKFWANLEEAALRTVQTGKSYSVNKRIKFGIQHGFLRMMLPSGRVISYYDPLIENRETPYGEMKPVVTYMAQKARVKNGPPMWTRVNTYGGKLAENCTQAASADILIEAMKRVNENWPVVFHVHDEIVAEISGRTLSGDYHEREWLNRFCEIVSELPAWASGLPLSVDGWIGKRYRK